MTDIAQQLQMGAYGAFVWPAYGLAAVGLIGTLIVSWRTLKLRERAFDTLKRERRGTAE